MVNWKKIPSQVYIKNFIHRYRTAFSNVNFFAGVFQGLCW